MRHAQAMANQMRLQALLAAGQLGRPRIGVISSYDPNSFCAKVKIQPSDTETGWLPICTMMAGAGFGVYFGPNNGDQCTVNFQEGDAEVGFITGFLGSDVARPPTVTSGEIWVGDKAGSTLVFTADGKVTLTPQAGFFVTGNTNITGNLKVTGNLEADGTVNLAGTGGQAVARVGDTVSGGVIISGSSTVKSN